MTPEPYYDQTCVDDGDDNYTSVACSQAGGSEEFALQNQEYPNKMYVLLLRPHLAVTDDTTCDVGVDSTAFLVTLAVYIVPLVLFTLCVWWFLDNKLDYNFDMIPSYVARQVLSGPEHNILGSIPASYKSGLRGDVDDVWFRRQLHYASKAIALVCWTPVVLWSSFGAALIGTTTPRAFGLCVLFLGDAFLLGGCATLAWRRRQWRMTVGIRRLYLAAAACLLGYLVFVSIFDSCGARFFSLTAAFLTVNMAIMSQVNFTACPHVADAYREIERHTDMHDEVMAEIMNSLDKAADGVDKDGKKGKKANKADKEEEDGDGDGDKDQQGTSSSSASASALKKGFTSYIRECYTIDGQYSLFQFSNTFTTSLSAQVDAVRAGGLASFVVLGIYCAIVRLVLPDNDQSAIGIAITVVLLDSSVSMLRNGLMSWDPAYITLLMLLSRAFLCIFNTEYWILGHAFAYSIFGIAAGREIVEQRLPRMNGMDAGAVAYFSRGDNVIQERKRRQHRARNVAGSPVFVTGFLLIVLCLTVVLSILTYGDDVPTVDLFSTSVPVTSIAIGIVVVDVLVVMLIAASRALYLQGNQLLRNDRYFCVRSVSMATLLSAIFVVYVIITGVLLMALTGSSVWVQVCVFAPPLAVTGWYGIAQYFRNDCSWTLTPSQRAKEIALWRMGLEDAKEEERLEREAEEALIGLKKEGDNGKNNAAGNNKKDDNNNNDQSGIGIVGKLFSATNTKNQGIKMPDAITSALSPPAGVRSNSKRDGDDDDDDDDEEGGGGGGGGAKNATATTNTDDSPVVLPPLVRDEDKEGFDPHKHQSCLKVFQLFWDGRLAPREYYTSWAMGACVVLWLLFGLCLAFFVRPWYVGPMVVLVGCTLALGLLPLAEYATTWQFKWYMAISLVLSYACLIGFCALLFLVVLEGSLATTSIIVPISLLWWWPELLLVGFTVTNWLERDFQPSCFINTSMAWLAVCLVVYAGVLLLWVQNWYVVVGYLLVVLALIYVYVLVQMWLRNDRFLPPVAAVVTAVVVAVVVVCSVLAAIIFGADLFFCLSVAFLTIAASLLGKYASAAATKAHGTPLGYNASVFPVYFYDPMHHDVFDASSGVWGVLNMFVVLLLWSATCAVYFVPVDLGVGLMAVVVVVVQAVLSHFSTTTVVQLGKSLRCVDQLILKTAAMQADERFQGRRSPFAVGVPPELQQEQQQLATRHSALEQLYLGGTAATGAGTAKAKAAAATAAAAAAAVASAEGGAGDVLRLLQNGLEHVDVAQVTAAAVERVDLDALKLESAEYYAKKILLQQNNLRYIDSESALAEHDGAMVGDLERSGENGDDTVCSAALDLIAFSAILCFIAAFLAFAAYFVAGYFYEMQAGEYTAQVVLAVAVLVWALGFALFLGRRPARRRQRRVDGVYDDAAALEDVWQTGGGPLGWMCCCGCLHKASNVAKHAVEASKGRCVLFPPHAALLSVACTTYWSLSCEVLGVPSAEAVVAVVVAVVGVVVWWWEWWWWWWWWWW